MSPTEPGGHAWPPRVVRAARALYWRHLIAQRRTTLPLNFDSLDEQTRLRLLRDAAAVLRAAEEDHGS